MSELIGKVLKSGRIPIMCGVGMYEVFKYYYNRMVRSAEFGKLLDGITGPSRTVRIPTSKKRVDDFNYNEEDIKQKVSEKLKILYGSNFDGNIYDDFPFGRLKNGLSGAEYDMRIYINAPFGEVRYKFILLYAMKCKERGIPCGAKFFQQESSGSSVDNMILYSSHENFLTHLEILEEIKEELPEFVIKCGSPIATGINYSYYAVCHYGDMRSTYNYWFNRLSCIAFLTTISKTIKENKEFFKSLSKDEQNIIDKICSVNDRIKKSKVKQPDTVLDLKVLQLSEKEYRVFRKIFFMYDAKNPILKDINILNRLMDEIKTIASLNNFGDDKHKDLPIALKESDYIAFGLNPENFTESKNNVNNKTNNSNANKKAYNLKKINEIIMLNDRKLATQVMLTGYSYADIANKTRSELLKMFFNKVKLDSESLIDVLSGGLYTLKQYAIYFGNSAESIKGKSREEIEKMFIEAVGVEEVDKANNIVKEKEKNVTTKRNNSYEIVLERLKRENLNKK